MRDIELARLLLRHPNVSTPTFFLRESRAEVRCLTELYPELRGWGEAPCKALSVEAIAKSGAEVVFLSTPHEASLELVPELVKANRSLRIVDLSGAYRFRNPETFANWYRLPAPDAVTLAEAVYGLPELYDGGASQGTHRRESRVLSHFRDSGPQAPGGSRLDRYGARDRVPTASPGSLARAKSPSGKRTLSR